MTNSLEQLREKTIGGRRILVYGAGNQGRGMANILQKHDIEPVGFVDRIPELQGRAIAGIPVYAPSILSDKGSVDRFFVVIAAFFFEKDVSNLLETLGYFRGISYLPYSALKPNDYALEVSGICNLHCMACPRASRRSSGRYSKMLSLENFQKVIAKLQQEDPFVSNIQLYQWGEPTLNPALPSMIRYAREKGILCTLSSNLNHGADFSSLIESRPECFRISVSGTGDDYEVTHTGGRWTVFLSHAEKIAKLRNEIYPGMKIELYHHLYKGKPDIQREQLAEFCYRFHFEYHPVPAYLISLDDVLNYCEGKPLPEKARQARELLLVDLDEGLARAKAEASLPCDSLRVTLINADLSVSTCMMYFDPDGNTCTQNFLETPMDEILNQRKISVLCKRCRKQGIHRYCGIYAQLGEQSRY
jgi:pyruvate-formate lyase-activating enzyme